MQRPTIRMSHTVPARLSLGLIVALTAFQPVIPAAAQPSADPNQPAVVSPPGKVRPGMVVGVEPEIITILLRQPKPPNAAGVIDGVELQGEVTDERTATEYGWRSMQMTLDIACRSRSGHVLSMNVFDEHGASGTPRAIKPPQSWVRLSQHTDETGAIDALCDRWARAGAGLSRAGTSRSQARPSDFDIGATPRAIAPSPSDSIKTSPGKAPSPRQSAQLASTTSEALAADLLSKLKARHPQSFEGLETRIEAADVSGTTHYRVIVSGFLTSASAKAFCIAVQPQGSCLIRSGG